MFSEIPSDRRLLITFSFSLSATTKTNRMLSMMWINRKLLGGRGQRLHSLVVINLIKELNCRLEQNLFSLWSQDYLPQTRSVTLSNLKWRAETFSLPGNNFSLPKNTVFFKPHTYKNRAYSPRNFHFHKHYVR